jgi:hypothetical protein
MNPSPVFTRASYADHATKLSHACEWLTIEQGRASAYARLVREFFEEGARTKDHVLAFNESCEIVDLFELWQPHADRFPGLQKHLRRVCRKGPLLREGENPKESTNRPRNDAFSYIVSGTLIAAGVEVVAVEGIPQGGCDCTSEADLTFNWKGTPIDVECKRPQTADALIPRMQEACDQIAQPARGGRLGVVALDCSPSIRAPGRLLEYEAGDSGERRISSILESAVAPMLNPHLTPAILGFILMARVPSMACLSVSPIVSARGRPFRTFRPESISSWLVVGNSSAPRRDVLREMGELVQTHQLKRRASTENHFARG